MTVAVDGEVDVGESVFCAELEPPHVGFVLGGPHDEHEPRGRALRPGDG